MASNPWMLGPQFGWWQHAMPPLPAWQLFLGDRPGAARIMMTGRRPALAALLRTFSMPCIKEMQRSPVPEPILVIEMDTTVELPAKPDSGSAGSSSCVSITQST